jgi:hypothetical protein
LFYSKKTILKQSFATDGIKVVTTGEQKILLKTADRLGRKSLAKSHAISQLRRFFYAARGGEGGQKSGKR